MRTFAPRGERVGAERGVAHGSDARAYEAVPGQRRSEAVAVVQRRGAEGLPPLPGPRGERGAAIRDQGRGAIREPDRGPTQEPNRNRTGLPDALKAGVERLSGLSLDDVRVHHDSPEPARLGARAFTRGTEIHVAPGQGRHLAHEAWHVVQQKQGRVRATTRLAGQRLNDDAGLEREADVMGTRSATSSAGGAAPVVGRPATTRTDVVQRLTLAPPAAPPAATTTDYGADMQKASRIKATILPGKLNGGKPSVSPLGWSFVQQHVKKVKGNWVQFHVLNQMLGGSGKDRRNLLPTTHKDNHSSAWRGFEKAAQGEHDGGETIHWEAEIAGYHSTTTVGSGGFPTGLEAKYAVWNTATNAWDPGTTVTLRFLAPSFTVPVGGKLTLHAAEVTMPQWYGIVGKDRTGPVVKFLLNNRDRWKLPGSDILDALRNEDFEADMIEVEKRIGRALGRDRKATIWLKQG